MATLEDKILGDKVHNYCSSSEDEFESSDEGDKASVKKTTNSFQKCNDSKEPQNLATNWNGAVENTGPKGVINDWQRYKQLENEKRELQEREKLDLFKKLSITVKTKAEDDKAKKEEEEDPELRELMRDEMLVLFQKQKMTEMIASSNRTISFGKVYVLKTGDDFLTAVDKECKLTTVVIHIYENNVNACRTMNKCIEELAIEYPYVKFCKMISSLAGMSRNFKKGGIPALLVYKAGQMIGNFVRLSDEFGDDFFSSDIESFLIEHAMIQDKSCFPSSTQK